MCIRDRTYTFHLRDAKWSNGDAVTAADFVFGWQRAVDPANASEYSYMLSDIGQVVNAAETVSYTHLDVYKRQCLSSTSPMPGTRASRWASTSSVRQSTRTRPGKKRRAAPVSYTHLDVYKRQDMECAVRGFRRAQRL